jgi:microcystin-dependent protein
MDPLIATIMMFGGNFAPRGWAFCHGQLLSISNNTALFSILGTQFGGDGRTTFGLPDLRGRTPIGYGHGSGLTPRSIGEKAGQEYVTLTEAQMPQHSHSAQASGGGLTVQNADANQSAPDGSSYIAKPRSTGGINTQVFTNTSSAPVDIQGGGTGQINVGVAGGSQSHNNMQPFLVLPYIIALEGIYPSRN